ncbi:hypothetical protein LOK49_LG13G02699 [Camellia lanceoleosa]|uniref:Uncharacterized protein n=1 Tax=Camellia lanceoleosa TaxID=1840588 RepID=A0ACC0FHJ9_9ERIC|nr:hypothetical protein LOK49_LG13G02699 [Camellia lanceoleosa]
MASIRNPSTRNPPIRRRRLFFLSLLRTPIGALRFLLEIPIGALRIFPSKACKESRKFPDLSLTMLCSNCFGCGSLSAYPLEYWRLGSIVWLLSSPPYEERTVPANPNKNRVFDHRTIFWPFDFPQSPSPTPIYNDSDVKPKPWKRLIKKSTTAEESTLDFGIGEEDDGEELGDFVRRELDYDDFRMERGRSLRKMVLVVGRGTDIEKHMFTLCPPRSLP